MKTHTTPRRPGGLWLAIGSFVLTAAGLGLLARPAARPAPDRPKLVGLAHRPGAAEATPRTLDIQSIALGQRVVGSNPERDASALEEAEPEPSSWRAVRLRMTKATGKRLDIALLRPLEWLRSREARVGRTVELNLRELGAAGKAEVLAIEPCPEIRPGTGHVVTGTFAHEPDNRLLNVRVEGQDEPIGCTDNHPFWSEDRGRFLKAGELRAGDRVRTLAGTRKVEAVSPRPAEALVYNIEVQAEHVYLVSNAGVLVHNAYNEETIEETEENRGLTWTTENTGKESQAKAWEDGATGARYRISDHMREVPALRYDNANPRGNNYARFDGWGRRSPTRSSIGSGT